MLTLCTTTVVPPDVWDIHQCGPALCTVELKRATPLVWSTGATDTLPARTLAKLDEGAGATLLDRTADEWVIWTRPGALALYACTMTDALALTGDGAILLHLLLHKTRDFQQG